MTKGPSSILVTGGCGFIGSHIVDAFVRKGWEVGILDNLSTGTESNLKAGRRVRLHKGDVRDIDAVRAAMDGYETVSHQAALVSVARSVEDPFASNAVNLGGTLNVLAAARDSGVERVVYASSSSVYGETETLPKTETMQTDPVSPYAVSKLAAENYCKAFARVYGLRTVSLRYFNVYGPRQSAGPYSGVIPAFVGEVLAGKAPVINGDGSQTRDFTYVQDAVQANVLCIEAKVKPGEVFNVGSSSQTSILELAKIVARLGGKPGLKPVFRQERKGDVKHSYADISKISAAVGYKPRYTLQRGLKEVFNWMAGSSRLDRGSRAKNSTTI
ncbi:MAG: SDR family oxidoreductase [Nitrososphaerales archaeon]